MKQDKRINNGGARPGAGNVTKPEQEKKVPITFYIKKKLVPAAKITIKKIVDEINSK